MFKTRFISMLVLLCLTVSGAWAQEVTLLTTIESTGDNASFTSGSKTFDNIATVTFSGEVENDNDDDDWGWYSDPERTLTVTAAEGYTITRVKFYTDQGSAFDEEAPFEAILLCDDEVGYNAKVNGTSIGVFGVTKIEVYGYETPAAPAGYTVTLKEDTEDATSWTITPAEATTTGVAAGTEVKATYGGTKKVKSVKAVKAAAAYAANEYNEASWDGTKVTFTKQTATSVTAVANSDAAVTWSDGWYTVSGNVTITGNVTLTADAHLILQDGATLTINGQLNCRTNGKNLYIYGQKKGDGKLNVTNNGAEAINSDMNYRIDIHGGEVTAAATGNKRSGLNTGYLAVYGGKLTATSGGGNGINFQNTFDVYGGEVEATSNATSSSSDLCGIRSGGGTSSQILTVYGGKVTATGNGVTNISYGSGIRCYVKSGTSGIKFYFSEDGNTWDEGTSYASATSVGRQNDDAATKKRYAKAE